jgi:hypothetical protein
MSHNLSLLPRELHTRGRARVHLDRPVRVGLGQWQKTPAQLSGHEICAGVSPRRLLVRGLGEESSPA